MNSKAGVVAVCALVALALAVPGQASVLVYDNLATTAVAGTSQPNSNNPVFGDSLTLLQGGLLESVGLSLYNSSSGGNTGIIQTGTMVVNFYDNTTPYTGGALSLPLLGTATLAWDFGADGLPAGYYSAATFDVSALNINLTQNILITQQFTQTAGTSTRNGVILFGDPTTGSSPNTVYLKSASTAEGLYTYTGNPGQFGYAITLVPEPASVALAGLGLVALLRRRRVG